MPSRSRSSAWLAQSTMSPGGRDQFEGVDVAALVAREDEAGDVLVGPWQLKSSRSRAKDRGSTLHFQR
jgi:hypothetical protein